MNKIIFLILCLFCLIIFYPSSTEAAACRTPHEPGKIYPQPITYCEPVKDPFSPEKLIFWLSNILNFSSFIAIFYLVQLFKKKNQTRTESFNIILMFFIFLSLIFIFFLLNFIT